MPDRSGEREIFMHNRLIRAAGAGLVCLALAAPVPVLAIVTLRRAWLEKFALHKKIARWTLPIWLYVSVTGVIVYLMLYQF